MRNRKLLFNLIAGLAIAMLSLPAAADLPFASPGKDSGMIVGSPVQRRGIFSPFASLPSTARTSSRAK